MDCSTPGLPVHHQLLKLAQTHVHQVSDAIQPSHRLSSPSPPPSIFPSIRVFSSEPVLHQVAKGLERQLQHQAFQRVGMRQDPSRGQRRLVCPSLCTVVFANLEACFQLQPRAEGRPEPRERLLEQRCSQPLSQATVRPASGHWPS